jgi:hypothetical protein
VVKPLGLVSFGTRIRLLASVVVVLDWQGESARIGGVQVTREALLFESPYNYCLVELALDMVRPIGALSES